MNKYAQISQERKNAYRVGIVLMTTGGVLCFGSIGCFVVKFALIFGSRDMPDFRFFGMCFVAFFIGMVCAIIGGVLQTIGARGLAGSGLKLDPEGAREDLKPWSKMVGGMIEDVGINLGNKNPGAPDFEEALRKLYALHQDGILTDSEYAEQKAAVLKSMT